MPPPRRSPTRNLFRTSSAAARSCGRTLTGAQRAAEAGEAPDLAAAVENLCEAAKVGRRGPTAWPDAADVRGRQGRDGGVPQGPAGQKLALLTEEPEGSRQAAVGRPAVPARGPAVAEAYQARKRPAGVVDFQDLLVLARDLLRDRAEVREPLQERFRYLLIDEMQDTDPVQMELVELLCGGRAERGQAVRRRRRQAVDLPLPRGRGRLFQGCAQPCRTDGRPALTRQLPLASRPSCDFVNALLAQRLPDYEPLDAHHPQVDAGAVRRVPVDAAAAGARRPSPRSARREADAHRPADRGDGRPARRRSCVERERATGLRPVRAPATSCCCSGR